MFNGVASGRRGGTFAVAAAAVVPVFFAGWLVWAQVQGGGPEPRPVPPPVSPADSGAPDGDRSDARPPARSLAGKVVVIDPGHHPDNRNHTAEINRLVDIGTNRKACDTTGTASGAGYPEAAFTLAVSRQVRELLVARGAKVTFTQDDDRPYGPCVDERARIGNAAKADAAVSVHADGSAPGNRGFHVIAPAAVYAGDADTRAIAGPSRLLATALISQFARATGSAPADYLGGGSGLTVRDDLGGLNLSTVPKVFIECGNMRDPQDAEALADPVWQRRAAEGIADGISDFLSGKR